MTTVERLTAAAGVLLVWTLTTAALLVAWASLPARRVRRHEHAQPVAPRDDVMALAIAAGVVEAGHELAVTLDAERIVERQRTREVGAAGTGTGRRSQPRRSTCSRGS